MSCPANKCLNNGKCSTRLNGNFYCECFPPSFGVQCEIGSLSLFYFICWSSLNKWKIGGLEIGEQIILTNFYNSLTSNGSLNWNLSTDLCDQTGVVCDSLNPKRVTQL